jgi:hypothetical protein
VPVQSEIIEHADSGSAESQAPSISVLHDVLASADEASVAAELHVSVRLLRRYAEGAIRMNWVTHTRLQRLAEGSRDQD